MKKIIVFYAWQSDTPTRYNRHLIRLALNIAAERISQDPANLVQIRIDADTEGVVGQPPVAQTILEKIRKCHIFMPDFTFVVETESGKRVPNPNVMIEYGYALHAKGHSAMLPVMNTHYGPAEQLPFDLRHLRHPLQYELSPKANKSTRRAVCGALANDFENILRLMIMARELSETSAEGTLGIFVPELARILANQIEILARIVPNFSLTSLKKPLLPGVNWDMFRPIEPNPYPTVKDLADLDRADAALLMEFYDSLRRITETINRWDREGTPDTSHINGWVSLLHNVRNSVSTGRKAVEKFCPDRQYSPIMPSGGTLLQRAEQTVLFAEKALAAHLSRHNAV